MTHRILEFTLSLGRATIDATNVSSLRTYLLPNFAGTFVVNGNGREWLGVPGVRLQRPATSTATVNSVVIEPVHGGTVPIWDSTYGGFTPRTISQAKDWTISGRTATAIHDVFAVAAGGTGIDIAIGPAWTSDTARSSALTFQNGQYWVNNASFTDLRTSGTIAAADGLYVGTVRFTGATASTFTAEKAFLYSYYHPERWALQKADGTAHNYNVNTSREWNGVTNTHCVEWLDASPDRQRAVACDLTGHYGAAADGNVAYMGIGLNNATAQTYVGFWAQFLGYRGRVCGGEFLPRLGFNRLTVNQQSASGNNGFSAYVLSAGVAL